MSGDPYVDPGTGTLRNRLGITNPAALDRVERRLVAEQIREGVPGGDFDLAHLCAIHRHLFQDIYDWAGEVRTVEIGKGGTGFMPCRVLEIGMGDVHRRKRGPTSQWRTCRNRRRGRWRRSSGAAPNMAM